MNSIAKYAIGAVAGAALMGGAGIAYSERGTARYEPCRMSMPQPGVTQLCGESETRASASQGGVTGAGSVGAQANVGNGGGSNAAPGGQQPGAGFDGTMTINNQPGIQLPDVNNLLSGTGLLPELNLPAIGNPGAIGLPNVAVPVPAAALPTLPSVAQPAVPAASLPSLQLDAMGTSNSNGTTANANLGTGSGGPGVDINVAANVDNSALLLGPHTPGGGTDPHTLSLQASAKPATTSNGSNGLNIDVNGTVNTGSGTPAAAVNASASTPSSNGNAGIDIAAAADAGSSGGGISASANASTGGGDVATASASTGSAGGITADVTAGSGGVTAAVASGGSGIVSAGVGDGGNVSAGIGGAGVSAGPAGLALY